MPGDGTSKSPAEEFLKWGYAVVVSTSEAKGQGRTGRRPGGSDARQDILDAAVELFSERGYEGASVRAIATAADVDPALVRHYFGDKSSLFVESVMSRAGLVEHVLAELRDDGERRGERLALAYLSAWEDDDVRPALTAVVASVVTSEGARMILREALPAAIARALDLTADDVSRIGLVGAQLLGVAMARYVAEIPVLTELSVAELAARIGPGLDVLLGE